MLSRKNVLTVVNVCPGHPVLKKFEPKQRKKSRFTLLDDVEDEAKHGNNNNNEYSMCLCIYKLTIIYIFRSMAFRPDFLYEEATGNAEATPMVLVYSFLQRREV